MRATRSVTSSRGMGVPSGVLSAFEFGDAGLDPRQRLAHLREAGNEALRRCPRCRARGPFPAVLLGETVRAEGVPVLLRLGAALLARAVRAVVIGDLVLPAHSLHLRACGRLTLRRLDAPALGWP